MTAEAVKCPCCHRQVPVTRVHRFVWPHNDKAGTDCPQGRKPLNPDEIYEVCA